MSDVTGFKARIPSASSSVFEGPPCPPSKYDPCWKSVPLTEIEALPEEAFRIACDSIFAAAAGRPPSDASDAGSVERNHDADGIDPCAAQWCAPCARCLAAVSSARARQNRCPSACELSRPGRLPTAA